MSASILQISCTSCTFRQSIINDCFYHYEIEAKKIAAPTMPGWCMSCKRIETIHIGLSPIGIQNELDSIESELNELQLLDPEQSYVNNKINDLQRTLALNRKYLMILNNQTSISHCTSCDSVEVFPMPLYYSHSPRIASEAYIHPGCRGQFRAELSGGRFSFAGDAKKVVPKLGWPWYSDIL